MAKVSAEEKLTIDYPVSDERITGAHYTFRIGSKLPGVVELSINDGPWLACRPAVGYWWFDWRCERSGSYTAVARAGGEGMGWTKSRVRAFAAELESVATPAVAAPSTKAPAVKTRRVAKGKPYAGSKSA